MVSLGIDASLRSTGMSLIYDNDSAVKHIATGTRTEGERLGFIYDSATRFTYGRAIDICVMEGPAFNATTKAFSMGEVYGLFKLLVYKEIGCPIIIVSPKELKKYLCSSGDATKARMISKAGDLGCPSDQEDICDSWAAGLLGRDITNNTNTPSTRAALEMVTKLRAK